MNYKTSNNSIKAEKHRWGPCWPGISMGWWKLGVDRTFYFSYTYGLTNDISPDCDQAIGNVERKIYNSYNKVSIAYNFDHILIYIMCKFHVSTTFHWFYFSPERQPSKMQIWGLNLALKASPSDWDVLYDFFLLSN